MTDPVRERSALIVDDDPLMRLLVAGGLEPLGLARVDEATDGEHARRLLELRDYDVVITDLVMPGLSGIELMRLESERPPLWIILSGIESFDAAVEAIHHGAFDFLSKPPDIRELEVSVKNALRHRDLLIEHQRLMAELHASNERLREKVRQLERTQEAQRQDLERAEVIQRALLPARPPEVPGMCFDALYRPGENVGGDLYDVARLGEHALSFYVADATGHGVSAAMLSVLFKQRLAVLDEQGAPLAPAEVLRRVGRRIAADVRAPGLFLTVAYGLYDLRTRELRVASAGHPPLLLARPDGTLASLARTGPALGLEADASFGEHRLQLDEGCSLLLFTDGLLDGLGGAGSGPPPEALARFLRAGEGGGQERLQALFEAASRRIESAALGGRDDITLLLVRTVAGSSCFDNQSVASTRKPRRASARPRGEPVVWMAEHDGTSSFQLRGRGSWRHADAFWRAATRALDSERRVVVDLAPCERLDSTFLGTIHELALRAGEGRLVLRGLGAPLRALFEELAMERVLAVVDGAPPPPTAPPTGELVPLAPSDSSSRECQLRLLRAHESLSALSARNRARFEGVVESLRDELGEG